MKPESASAHPDLSDLLGLAPGDLLAIMGAGGKATVMKRLVQELLEKKTPVIVTSTTNLHALGEGAAPSLLLSEAGRDQVTDAVRDWAARGAVIWVEKKLPKNMFRGLAPDRIEALHAEKTGGVLLVKTDGARKRLLKVPGGEEPVLPRSATHALLIFGLSAIGRPAGPDVIHRFERTCALTGLKPGEAIEPRHVAAAAAHPESYPSRLTSGIRRFLYLSHCNGPAELEMAREIWKAIPAGLYEGLLAGNSVEGKFYAAGDPS